MNRVEVFRPVSRLKHVNINGKIYKLDGIVYKNRSWRSIMEEVRRRENRNKMFVFVKTDAFMRLISERGLKRFVYGILELAFLQQENKVFFWDFQPKKHKIKLCIKPTQTTT